MIAGFWEKLGFWSRELTQEWKARKDWIWFHAVSIGELNAIWPLVLETNKLKSSYPIMISVTTKAGHELATKLIKDKNFVLFYFPFDIPYIIKSLLNYAKTKLLIIAETEIWPITLSECRKRNIPVILVNGRLSNNSFKNYIRFKFFFKNIVNLFSLIIAQSQKDAEKFLALGAKNEKVISTGNIKFSAFTYNLSSNTCEENALGKGLKIIFASTHKGEESIALEVFKDIQQEFQDVKLIIAPRHIERVKEITRLISENGFTFLLKSKGEKIKSNKEIFVLDTIGELNNFYKMSDIAVVGGTFVKVGGHNILEPIKANTYTIIGPFDYKISEMADIFKSKNALVQVQDKDELKNTIKKAILDSKLRKESIQNGIKIIEENEHILKKVIEHIHSFL